jgi:electron transport complex protein RnfB
LSENPYERLAVTLDKIPNGFTATEGGTHLRVLEWIFTPEEADLASRMRLRGETVEELVGRLEVSEEVLEELLERMAEKGQIRAWNSSSGRRYALLPFVVGVYDEQLDRMDGEFAQLVEDYLDESRGGDLWGTEPTLFKVIPINSAISAELEIYPYEVAEQMVENSKSWGVRECVCKKHQGLLDNPCNYGISKCIQLHPRKERVFEDSEITETITKDEALRILKEAEEAGLIHSSMNTQKDHLYICNCCSCCCLPFRGLTKWEQPHAFVRSNYQASVNTELCNGCETCLDRCQFEALNVSEEVCVVNTERCIGCGVCTIGCPDEALTLVARDPGERETPPESVMEWGMSKAFVRGVDPSELL